MVELANELTETEEVVFAFPNFVSEFRRAAVPKPNAAQWHLKTVKAASAWAVTQGEGITVAIIDDGVDINHPNLKGNSGATRIRASRRTSSAATSSWTTICRPLGSAAEVLQPAL